MQAWLHSLGPGYACYTRFADANGAFLSKLISSPTAEARAKLRSTFDVSNEMHADIILDSLQKAAGRSEPPPVSFVDIDASGGSCRSHFTCTSSCNGSSDLLRSERHVSRCAYCPPCCIGRRACCEGESSAAAFVRLTTCRHSIRCR